MTDHWDLWSYGDVRRNVPRKPLPNHNRGSWYCPVATKDDAQTLDYYCRKEGINRIYDLGAGTLELAYAMDKRGYDVVAYETIEKLTTFAERHLPSHDVDVRCEDYYAAWDEIRHDDAAFVAMGIANNVPTPHPSKGIVFDGKGMKEALNNRKTARENDEGAKRLHSEDTTRFIET